MTPYTPPEPFGYTLVHPRWDTTEFLKEYVEPNSEYGWSSVKLFTESQLRSEVERVRRETVEDCAVKMETQHTWLTNVAAANIIRSLK